MAKKREENRLKISIKSGEKTVPIDLVGLLFDRDKNFIERVDIKKDSIHFEASLDKLRTFNLLIAPKTTAVLNEKNYNILLSKHKAYKPKLFKKANKELEILSIPELYIPFWNYKKCRVFGNVFKEFNINNFSEKKGLCNMRVHICEVDKIQWLIPRIPDDIILRIPDLILRPEIPVPVPTLPDPPLPNPPFEIRDFNSVFSGINRPKFKKNISINKKILLSDKINPVLSDRNIMTTLKSKNPRIIRNTIVENFKLFHPYFCHISWLWPYFYKCDELRTVYTDANGDFDTEIYYSIFGDHPDLYFWVEAFIDDQWETVYKPQLPCNTYWNYKCGTEVHINVTDPRVRWECSNDIDGELIWVKTINWGTSVSHIEQKNVTGNAIQGRFLNRQGLTDKHENKGNFRRPFGKGLSFVVQFSNDLPSSKYTYYRWSYKKLKHADLSNAFGATEKLNNLVQKTYSYIFQDINGHFHFNYNKVKLGPFDKGVERGLYLIPTTSPTDAPFNATEQDANWDQNTRTISFDSSLEGDGLYEFSLELFDRNGNKITNIPNELFQVPDYDTFTPSINAPSVNLESSGRGTCSAFKMVMRIDNSPTKADIYKIKVDGKEVNPTCCGFVPYKDNNSVIEIKFRAYHPHNFADLSFRVQKGTCTDTNQANKTNTKGMVIGNVPTNDGGLYTRNSFSEYTKTFSPADLLGTCLGEERAAFAEHLYVNALATNGNHEIDAYDSSKLVAFALDKK